MSARSRPGVACSGQPMGNDRDFASCGQFIAPGKPRSTFSVHCFTSQPTRSHGCEPAHPSMGHIASISVAPAKSPTATLSPRRSSWCALSCRCFRWAISCMRSWQRTATQPSCLPIYGELDRPDCPIGQGWGRTPHQADLTVGCTCCQTTSSTPMSLIKAASCDTAFISHRLAGWISLCA